MHTYSANNTDTYTTYNNNKNNYLPYLQILHSENQRFFFFFDSNNSVVIYTYKFFKKTFVLWH